MVFVQEGSIEVKRFYVDFAVECPECGELVKFDDYISYPELNKPEKAGMYCPKCDNDWEQLVQVAVAVETLKEGDLD